MFAKPQRDRLPIRRSIRVAGKACIEILLRNTKKRQSSKSNFGGATVVSSEPHEGRLLGMARRQLEALLDSFDQGKPVPIARLRGANSKVLLEKITRRTLFANTSAKTNLTGDRDNQDRMMKKNT